MEILAQLALMVLGALVSAGVSILLEKRSIRSSPIQLLGKWFTRWKPVLSDSQNWVEGSVEIVERLGKLELKSEENSGGYRWQGTARLVQDGFLVGEWRSCKPAAHARGVFTLAVEVEGGFLCGFFMGPETPGARLASPLVLGRTSLEVDRGVTRLGQSGLDSISLNPA